METIIAKTLYSLSGLVYPKNLYDLIVIADNCTDRTSDIAQNLGAIVLERSNHQEQSKDHTLQWAFDQIMEWDKNYDAFLVFDSGSLVSGNYLEVMNYYLDHGSKVIQSGDFIVPQRGAWRSEVIRIGFLLYYYVRPMGRKVLGFDVGLRGNGMCFTVDVLDRIPWKTWSLTKSVEYGLMFQLEGVKIDFAPEAKVCVERKEQVFGSESQSGEEGKSSLVRKYAPKLFKAAYQQRSFKYIDSFLDLITPRLISAMIFVLAMCAGNIFLWYTGWVPVTFFWIWFSMVILGILHLLVGLWAAGADSKLFKSVLFIPLYISGKALLYLKKLLFTDEKQQIIHASKEHADIIMGSDLHAKNRLED